MNIDILHLDEVASTNSWLLERGATSSLVSPSGQPPSPVVVVADYQTGGRGCGTNRWESQRGQNLLFSLLFAPAAIPAARQFLISMDVSLAVRDTLADYVGDVTIKWPNDIYVGSRKICGILIENRLAASRIVSSVVGVGVNVNQQQFLSPAPNPVSLRQLLGHDVSREQLLQAILGRITLLRDSATPATVDADRYRTHLFRRTGYHPYRDAGGPFEARLVTVEDDGHLLLCDRQSRLRRYAFKEVEFLL